MDPFTQRILERAEQRSKTLGISKATKFPLSEFEQKTNQQTNQLQVRQKSEQEVSASRKSPPKVVRQYSVDKENLDVGIEINITTGPNVEVQVEVEEKDIGADGKVSHHSEEHASIIRDSSRNRLQRLGALYSDTDNLSSPIHRTEGKFHEEDIPMTESSSRRPKQKLGKLTALADSIKNWEDDTSHPDYKAVKLDQTKSANSPDKKALQNKPTQITASPQKTIQSVKQDSADSITKKQLQEKRLQWEKSVIVDKETQQLRQNKDPKEKKLQWDKTVMDSLEAQGFQRRQSNNSKYCYDYQNTEKNPEKCSIISIAEKKSNTEPQTFQKEVQQPLQAKEQKVSNIRTGLVSGRAAAFESKATASPTKPQKDPAEMSLKERMMFFEKNKGKALIPKAAFAMSAPIPKAKDDLKKVERKAPTDLLKGGPPIEGKVRDKVAALIAGGATISESKIKADIMKQRQQDMNILASRFNRQKELSQSESEAKSSTTTESMPPPPPPMPFLASNAAHNEFKQTTNKRRSPGSNNIVEDPSSCDEKRIKVNPVQKPGRLYPVLSDIETTDSDNDNCTAATVSARSVEAKTHRNTYHNENEDFNESFMDSEDSDAGICNVSLGREIMQVVQSNEAYSTPHRKTVKYAESNSDAYCGDSSVNSGVTSDASGDIDDYLDEALEDDEESDTSGSFAKRNTTNGTTSSNSFSYKKQPKNLHYEPISEDADDYRFKGRKEFTSPVKSALTVNPSDDNNMVTLVHTVSFYRRQQSSNSNNSTPVRRIQREQKSPGHIQKSEGFDAMTEDSASDQEETHLAQEKIKKLLDEVCKQQQVIGQTSQALNLCAATIEFSGSTESVEGERHLLVATHRRQAALDEVQRLRVEGCLRPHRAPKEKGRLIVREITVPLRQDYIRKLSNDTISGHHLVCLLKYNENVLATKTIPTLPGLLAVKFPDVLQLNNVYADFKITLEIYGMTAQREVLPHDVKYHINLNKKSGSKTPKSKKENSRLIMPMVQSPAGPNVVRTPALVQYGFVIFSLREMQRNTWTLNQALGVSPLEGIVHMKVNCELSVSVEYKGFLTMFEDVTGFGAWHRRWCQLNGHVLNYWKYPDDEKKKAPMGSIDLYACCSPTITTAPRDVCARLNTLLLECQRPAEDTDFESLIIVPRGKVTIVRHLLSADTKEERDEWTAHFNKALSLLRAWSSQR